MFYTLLIVKHQKAAMFYCISCGVNAIDVTHKKWLGCLLMGPNLEHAVFSEQNRTNSLIKFIKITCL